MLKVQVKAKHIKNGVCASTSSCALALAVLDAIPSAVSVIILNDIAITHDDGGYTYYGITRRASNFIDTFDWQEYSDKRVKPTSFVFKQHEDHIY